jgi:hypothetical protein
MFWGTARADKKVINLPANSVTLLGGGYDNAGKIVKYEWSKVSGPNSYSISNKWGSQTLVHNLTQGTYVFLLVVTDSRGYEASDKVTITVKK